MQPKEWPDTKLTASENRHFVGYSLRRARVLAGISNRGNCVEKITSLNKLPGHVNQLLPLHRPTKIVCVTTVYNVYLD